MLDTQIFLQVAVGLALLLAGAALNRFLERRVKLVAFYGHFGSFALHPPPQSVPPTPSSRVHTHSVVILNSGALPAHNVRIPHNRILGPGLHVSVEPNIQHVKNSIPNGGEEIIFPTLAPGQQIVLSYLYFPPVTWDQINLPISSDEGLAKVLHVLPTPQMSPTRLRILKALIFIGAVTVLYAVWQTARWGIEKWGTF